ncbi:hypothetical protein KP79_PYT24588 [Mizuhopecten yessoensis]|uniref:ADGRA2/3 GAIN domain-containing protein n=1 Tax=Mizuhopecten yessoensis TaxID=6573 RepID=A0A210R6S5_MIZYE|nr:hypothetical protein KP79_PYT24588 [Mizuhopecten yessoensis]
MQCRLERNLMDFENMVTYFDGVPKDAYIAQANGVMTEITLYGDDYKNIGDYWCEIQNTRTSAVMVSNKVRYEFPQSSSLTYRGYANFTALQQNLTISLHNLGFQQDARYLQSSSLILGFFSPNLNNAVQDLLSYQEPPLSFNRDIVSGYREIGKISEYGTSVGFSVYLNMRILNRNEPKWYTPEKDQLALSILRERIESFLNLDNVPSRRKRRKRQANLFLPNVVLLSIGSCSAFSVYNLDLDRSVSFRAVAAGDTAFSKEICITDKRPLANVTCIRSFYNGAFYGDIRINPKCVFNDTASSGSTTTLQRLAETNITGSNTTAILEETYNLTRVDDLTSLDVIYTASILTNVAESSDQFDQKSVEYSADIVNTMIGLNDDILKQAQDTGSGTSRLVEAFEIISNNIVLDATNSASIVRPFVASKITQFSGDTNLVVGLQLSGSPEVTITNSSLTVLEDERKLNISVTDAAILLPKTLLQESEVSDVLSAGAGGGFLCVVYWGWGRFLMCCLLGPGEVSDVLSARAGGYWRTKLDLLTPCYTYRIRGFLCVVYWGWGRFLMCCLLGLGEVSYVLSAGAGGYWRTKLDLLTPCYTYRIRGF